MLKTLSLYLASAIGLMRMFQKAGYFDKKLAFVPILNEYLVFRLAGVQKEFLLYLVSSLASGFPGDGRDLLCHRCQRPEGKIPRGPKARGSESIWTGTSDSLCSGA